MAKSGSGTAANPRDHAIPGALRLKGAGKKKSKKSKKVDAAAAGAAVDASAKTKSSSPPPALIEPEKTPAELEYEATMRERRSQKIEQMASKSHRERVAEFNAKLEKLTEHNDLLRISGS
ncbi:hypothetical protein H696_02262 [Fonticula alba]|uniref:DUF1754-domain-containing protein n=1 Tax=Fonticula alba TaxID=691883 RepID=A0A058ZBL0_FONAL|nr:hypothetical protein H696_02262 [Fonticula alba]KCV71316.1 hypothetical protein H696_02262 [Fonticula alba]|eukprot:XP_009494439.1 hypothetical protein H696_02262 [Fonticula alba]